jgi:hypothetical protein
MAKQYTGGRKKHTKNKSLPEPKSIAGLEPRLTGREAAAFLRLSHKTLEVWRCLGKGPKFIRTGSTGRSIRYRLSDLQAFEQEAV